MKEASIIMKGNAIFDGTGKEPFQGSIVIRDNRIIAVLKDQSPEAYTGPDTKVLEYGNQLIMPGFNDGHTHITQGCFFEDEDFSVNVLSADSKEEAIQMAKDFAESHPENEWVYGYMVNNLIWADQTLPTCHDIDRVIADRPVVLQMADMHTVIANSCALRKGNITRDSQSPEDGIIEKDEKGELTGRLFDGAAFQLLDWIFSPERDVYLSVYRKFFEKIKRLGITSASLVAPFAVHDDPIPYFEELEKEGKLTARIMIYPNISEYEKETFAALRAKYQDGRIRVQGLKQLLDGVTGVHTAYLLEPYTNQPDTCGACSVDLEEFRVQALEAIKDGVPLRVHTIGDRAVREMLDIFEEGEKLYGRQGLRHVQEHLETVDPADMNRFAELGITCCMQPWHMLFDLEGGDKGNDLYGDKEAAVGKERAKHSWPMRELLDAGTVLSLGSDYPVVGIEPLNEIYGAITRQTFDGKPEGGWYPEQRITMAEALKAYTWGSAYCEGCEEDFGTLAEGKLADIIVLDKNLFEVEPKEILDTKVVLTMLDGNIIYEKQ
ncbi:MAG: amidohydrolase [Hespellia sp.]|nr:amidohydrolase [Hespellia sp.]